MSKDNEGAIWKNEKREKDTHPHFTGSATIDGVEYYVNAWKRGEDANEKAPALKFSFKPKGEKQSAPAAPAAKGGGFVDDDIPW